MSLRNANLNLMPVLRELLKHQSVNKTAQALGLSPSATSQALAQLRLLMDDQLLVRVGSSMKLTPKAIELIGPLGEVCADLEKLLERDVFEPRLAQRELRIASSDVLVLLFARPLMQMLQQEAPGICLHFVDIGRDLTDRMAAREIDFALLPAMVVEDLAPAPLRFRPLIENDIVALMSLDHPLAAQDVVSQADLGRYQHVTFQPDVATRDAQRAFMVMGGEALDIAVRVPQMTVMPYLLPGTRYVSIVPARLAEIATANLPLASRPLAYRTAIGPLGVAWSPIYDSDPAHKWFRSLIERRFGEF